MRLIDSHCHLNYEGLVERQAEVLENARERGVAGFLNISTRQREWKDIIGVAEREPDVWASVGVHPHAIPDHPAVGLDLRFTRTAEEAEAASLALEVGPAADQASGLIVEVRKLYLQPSFGRGGALPEYFQNQSSTVDHLGADLILEILLLDRSQRRIDDQQPGALFLCELADFLDLPLAEQSRRPDRADAECLAGDDVNADRPGQSLRLFDARIGRPPRSFARKFGHRDDRAFAARDLDCSVAVKGAQDCPSSSLLSCSPPSVSGCAG